MLTHFSNDTDLAPINPNAEAPRLQLDCVVTGNIDGKIDNGYLVTVNLGSEELKGVLFHCPDAFHSSGSSTALEMLPHREQQEKSQIAVRVPSRPKPNARGYTFFFAEQYPKLEPLYHGQEKAISTEIGRLWGELTEAERLVYKKKGEWDKRRYKSELLKYRSNTFRH